MMNLYLNKASRICILLFAFSAQLFTNAGAQNSSTTGLSPEVISWTISTIEYWPSDKYKSLQEAMIDNKFFVPLVFRGSIFPQLEQSFSRNSLTWNKAPSLSLSFDPKVTQMSPIFKRYKIKKSLDDLVYKNLLLANPKNFIYSAHQLADIEPVKTPLIEIPKESVKVDVKEPEPTVVRPIFKFIPDRKYWTSSFAGDIKFSQNKTSPNWHKGEINNINFFINTNTSYNYVKNKISLTNNLLTTFTINNALNDTLRKYTIGNDELRFRSNLALKAVGNWNYSSSAEFITSLGNKYMPNSKVKNAAFLSPFTVNAGVGMTYAVKPKFKRENRSTDLSMSIEPLAFKYMYSKDKNINLPAHFTQDKLGNYKHSMRTFGSTITMTQTTKIGGNALYTRFYYFTNYERVIGELENKLDIALNKYFSVTLYLYLRYDDGVAKTEKSDTYLQTNELISFGFSYRW